MPSSTTTPTYSPGVQRVPVDAPLEDVIHLLKRDGGVFIKGLVSADDADQAYSECKWRLDADQQWDGSFFPGQ